ncbi:hypothetical protein K435DRAFT_794489 [Dendrothele bispora CBS 962.96]|uniref:Uncharacterized protein n=1 Tax=Dendrothele bispora (strain CBS 962.96) TaxID=1314807 RepID=A0A4S8MBZ6_DENBC|nr:hypothetical protein K435DRAFT_794489 [Dendrothele bispora CBS 962.96]
MSKFNLARPAYRSSTSGDFIGKLANTFQKVVEEENLRQRNEVKPMQHTFVVQGTEKLYMVHTPSFHMAGGRYQLIFSGEVSGENRQRYEQFKKEQPNTMLTLSNTTPLTLDDIINSKSFTASVTNPDNKNSVKGIEVFNIEVVKKRSLSREDFESTYPERFMPFYLYGTSKQQHIDHMLLLDPNIQLTASNVRLELKETLSAENLGKGLILYANNVHEASMQPFPLTEKLLADKDKFFFSANKKLNVSVYRDPFPTVTDDPIKLDQVKDLITTGTLTLGSEIFIDSDKLNYEAHPDVPSGINPSKGEMTKQSKQKWKEIACGGKTHKGFSSNADMNFR